MKELFDSRRHSFINQMLKYLRYVFNDHFVLVLMFLLGFILIQYSQFLTHFPKNRYIVFLVLFALILLLLSWGRVATYLESADQQFLLPKETEVLEQIKRSKMRSFGVWVGVQSIVLIILAPIFLRLGFTVFSFFLFLVVLAFVKWFIIDYKVKKWIQDGKLDWKRAVFDEERRKQSLLKFFALFTTVKGLSTSVKRRQFLDGILKLFQKQRLWFSLYVRAFLRSGDYFSLFVRLFVLSLLSLLFIRNHFLSASLALVFNYLLFFQLLALYRHYDYQYLITLYPVDRQEKKQDLQQFLRRLAYFMTAIELLMTFNIQSALLIVIVMIILVEVYLSHKIGKMID
ncbi:ABC transporter permease [Streptococcus sciuri]|uniref:ABC transporter permease n=1 Tax=Streptococcus sciuri TaxID=2973939 RepID=A0ABT2F718_9STRE|nr:ABC transporter permease [Streptococcus sciuri]MCS4488180.1 ABC transporter permease [Streptococcus sciuri]